MSPIKLPGQTLTAYGSGRQIQVRRTGVPIVLIYHSRNTADLARDINNAVRDKYPQPSDILVASIVDLHIIPKLIRGVTEKMVEGEYHKAAAELGEGQAPEDIIIILVDWNGKMTKGAGFSDTNKQVGLIVLDAAGDLVDIYQGDDPINKTLELVNQAINGT